MQKSVAFIEVVMRFLKGHFLSVAWLSMLCLSTGSFADDLIRCVDEKTLETLESEDPCKFYRINDGRTASLWVVPEGEDPKDKSLAVPGAEFFVYAPQEQKLDSIKLMLKSDNSEVKNLTAVTSPETDGLVRLGISSPYGVYNFNVSADVTDMGGETHNDLCSLGSEHFELCCPLCGWTMGDLFRSGPGRGR